MVAVDVLILGGGVQGLVLLDELSERGFGCLLVTPSDLGSGQTLHSHGLLNSGSGLLTGQLREPIEQALAFARRRGLQLYGDDQWYLFAPGAAFEQVRQRWDALQHPYPQTPRSWRTCCKANSRQAAYPSPCRTQAEAYG
jgi:glycine/D-amino acid oxidase-like deaminating enzyme